MSSRQEEVPTEISGDRTESQNARRLVAMWSGGSLHRALPPEGSLTIGRSEAADVNIDHTSVSRRHAILTVSNQVLVEDLGSANGTWVGGQKIAAGVPTEVEPGVVFEIGSVMFVVRDTLRRPGQTAAPRPDVVVADPEMERLFSLLELAAQSNLTVILLGETGVGKDVLASHVHASSKRNGRPYAAINCAALVETLLEAELFGYERGAFTGADRAKEGLLESAHTGTVFLDELGEMPPSTQGKLLRVLETGEIMRIGSVRPRSVDLRFVCATNRDLKQRIAEGMFRSDLFFRLDGVSVRVPPLRERPTEIAALARVFVRQACLAGGRTPMTLEPDAIAALSRHPWPGNVRELKNVIARSVVFARGSTLTANDLSFEGLGSLAVNREAASQASAGAASPSASDLERKRIEDALTQCVGNQTRAAALLGVSRRTLLNRLDALGIPRPRKT